MTKVTIPGERFRVEFVAITVGIAAPFFIGSLLLVFFPSVNWNLPAWEVGLNVGLLIMPWAFGFWGLFLGFRYYTDKVFWSNRVAECSNPKMVDLGPGEYQLAAGGSEDTDRTLDPAKREELEKAGVLVPVKGAKNQLVDRKALALGGFWWGGFAVHPGQDGYVLFFGKEWMNLHGNIFIPKNLILIHHSQVDQDILWDLERATVDNGAGRFVPYKTALYVCGDMDSEVIEFMCGQTEIREGVLERIGVAGVAREFATKVLRTLGKEKATEIGLSMKGWQALIDPSREYLLHAGLYSEASQRGMQTVGGLRGEIRRLQELVTNLEVERRKNLATIQKYSSMVYGDSRRASRYQSGYTEGPQPPTDIGPDRTRPGWDQTTGNR